MSVRTRYILALSLIAILVSTSAVYLQTIFAQQQDDASLINLAGQQRMLMHRIALLVERIEDGGEEEKPMLADSLTHFAQNHLYLSTLEQLPSSAQDVYFGPKQLDKRMNQYLAEASKYLQSPLPVRHEVLFESGFLNSLFKDLDLVVSIFETEAQQRVDASTLIEQMLWLVTIVVLVLEVFLIFRPMERSINLKMAQLSKARQTAEASEKRALEASQVKSEFLANMSHEIRTPMNGILGTLQILQQSFLDNTSKDLVNKASYSAKSLLTIINDILDYSKIEANKLALQEAAFAMLDILESVQFDVKAQAEEKGIDFVTVIERNFQDGWKGDAVRIRQILLNLVSNAVKFTESGYVRVKLSHARHNERQVVRFDVEDSGIGMSQEQLAQVFERFSQADSSTTRRYAGTGLGMSITRSLIDLMGGELEIDSAEGKGTKAIVYLPLEPVRLTYLDKNDALSDAPDLTGRNILIAEDNDINQTIIEALMAPTGASLDFAENGLQALEAFKRKTYDLVLMDIQMPEMDGIEAQALIHKMDASVPVVALTANVMAEDVQKYQQLGFTSHVAKPVDVTHLYQTLRSIVG